VVLGIILQIAKSVLLGSVAGVFTAVAGHAADLPVKAKPVEYVKVCSLYGAGFYYMPGTDMCIKIGGWARSEAAWGNNGSLSWGAFSANINNRTTSNFATRYRGYITADAREQTSYGTARAYIAVGFSSNTVGLDTASNVFSANRAFLQWAGFTTGLTQSFYDFYSASAVAYRSSYLPTSDTSDSGWWVWAYTAQLGNGVSATISAEARRINQIIEQSAANTIANGGSIGSTAFAAGSGYGGWQAPDVVANLRADGTWGSAQVMGALHDVNAPYYATAAATTTANLGHPADKWGWVIGAGVKLNVPVVAKGDFFQAQVNYTQGALRYLYQTENTNMGMASGASLAYGVASDCVFGGTVAAGNATGCELTTGWSAVAGYDHYWLPYLHQSLVGAYMNVNYDRAVNAMLCSLAGAGNGNGAVGTAAVATAGCNNNWSYWGLSSRLQWDVTKTFYVGAEIFYSQVESAHTFNGLVAGTGYVLAGSSPVTAGDQRNLGGGVRMHKDFLP
jgi:hypothetical protein